MDLTCVTVDHFGEKGQIRSRNTGHGVAVIAIEEVKEWDTQPGKITEEILVPISRRREKLMAS